jgi:hypothetical protein
MSINHNNCGCDPGAPLAAQVPSSLPAPPACEGEQCESVYSSDCVIYNGQEIKCAGIEPGMILTEVIEIVAHESCKLEKMVHTASSNCIALTGDGTQANPLTASPIISPVRYNFLNCSEDGLEVIIDSNFVEAFLNVLGGDPELRDKLCAIACNLDCEGAV